MSKLVTTPFVSAGIKHNGNLILYESKGDMIKRHKINGQYRQVTGSGNVVVALNDDGGITIFCFMNGNMTVLEKHGFFIKVCICENTIIVLSNDGSVHTWLLTFNSSKVPTPPGITIKAYEYFHKNILLHYCCIFLAYHFIYWLRSS